MRSSSKFLFLKRMKKLTFFSLPLSLGLLVHMAANFISMLIVAKLGKTELAAAALAVSTFLPILTISTTIFYAIGILISHHTGQERAKTEIGILVKNGFFMAVLCFIPAAIALYNIDKVLLLFGQDPALVELTKPYFHYAAFVLLPSLIGVVITQFYSGIGFPRFTLIVSLITLPLIVFFSYALILGKFGFPKLGLGGVSCSTLIVQTLIISSVLFLIKSLKSMREYAIFKGLFKPDLTICKTIFSLGFPIGVQFGGELAAMAVVTYFMGYYGVPALAAAQIVSQYSMLTIMIILGLTQAGSLLISQAFAKKSKEIILEYTSAGLVLMGIVFLFFMSLFIFIPEILIKPFLTISDPQNAYTIYLAKIFFLINGVLILFDGARNFLSSALRGLHDSKAPMKIGLFCLWFISLPVSAIAGLLFWGPIGLRAGFVSGFVIATLLLWKRICKRIEEL
jgi:putative MATE family efflux protein